MKKLNYFIFLFGLLLQTTVLTSCGQGDDNPCNGAQYVYFAKSNKLLEALNTDSNQYFLYTNLEDSFSKPDSIHISVGIDTPFIKRYRNYNSDCYECDAEVETFVTTISEIPNQDDILLEYDDCFGYRMRIGLTVNSINSGLRYIGNGIDIKLNDSFGVDYILYKSHFKIERL